MPRFPNTFYPLRTAVNLIQSILLAAPKMACKPRHPKYSGLLYSRLRWALLIILAAVAVRLFFGSDAQSKVATDAHPRRVYFPNFVMELPQGYAIEWPTTAIPITGQGILMFMTTWPEFGSIPAEQSMAIMLEKDGRKNRRMDVSIESMLQTMPIFRRDATDAMLQNYVYKASNFSGFTAEKPGLVDRSVLRGLKGYGRTEFFLKERYAQENRLALIDVPTVDADVHFSLGADGHVERLISCTAFFFADIPEAYNAWQVPRCTHHFYIDDLMTRVRVRYHRDFAHQWQEIESRITALVRDNLITRMEACFADEDPCHCAIRFQKESSRVLYRTSPNHPFDPNSPQYDPTRRCAERSTVDLSMIK